MNKEARWHVVNSLLAGLLVFVGAFADGSITSQGIIAALSTALIVMITKFRDYWSSLEHPKTKIFNFI